MPVYEYRCQQCGEVFSHLFRTLKAAQQEEDAPPCPACGGRGAQRLVSSVAVVSAAGGSGGESEETATESQPNKLFGRRELQQVLRDRGY